MHVNYVNYLDVLLRVFSLNNYYSLLLREKYKNGAMSYFIKSDQ